MTEFTPLIDIEVEHDEWTDALPEVSAVVTGAIEAAFAHMGAKEQLDLVVLLTDDAEMKALNKEFRQKNAPTNVLSFPAPDMMHPHLGDMALGFETCVREAKEQNKSLKDHVAHLSVHGVLHLLGYDHMNDAEAEEMEDLERKILQGLGIADPYLTEDRP
ncbi:MAG: rRNA maturation RNase YbeY [Asticcacaulis sp.]